nr:farnesol dehydrogenase-like [Halyomorpha halys]
MERWNNRVAVVTGASEGMGEAIVRRLAAEGMKVVALARREAMLKELEKELTEKKLYVRSHVCDVTDDDQVQAAFQWIEDNVGPVSVLVNNAGVLIRQSLTEIETSSMRTIVNTNLGGMMGTTIQGLRSMRKNGIDDGHIFYMNSIYGHRIASPKISVYNATKHGVTVLAETLKTELGEKKSKIRVTSISPGATNTSINRRVIEQNPSMRYLEPKDIAETIIYALSAPANVNWGSEMERWNNRVAVVTGASEGIGEAIVRRLAAEGMKVVALARREAMLKEIEKELTEKKLYVRGYVCDVTDDDQVQAAFKWIEDNVGPVSVLVNNAGVVKMQLLTDQEISAIRSVIDTNLTGLLETTIHGFRSMKKNGIDDGHIININSVCGHRVLSPAISVYTATKHGVTVLSETLKTELGEKKSKIRVTSVSPGAVKTSMNRWYLDQNPSIPFLDPKDIVESIIFALSAPPNVNISEITVEPV